MSEKLERQNEVIIALLARSVLGVQAISQIVCAGKRNPEAYRKTYNALQGNTGVTEIAKLAGVSQPTMSVVLQSWEEQGIIFNAGATRKPQYQRLLHLPPIKRMKGDGK
jgi:DNA-binding MarR family transcriptional regulator